MKVERISEKLQKTIPKLGGYIFDKYLSDILQTERSVYYLHLQLFMTLI
jgi:hypothetical protein